MHIKSGHKFKVDKININIGYSKYITKKQQTKFALKWTKNTNKEPSP